MCAPTARFLLVGPQPDRSLLVGRAGGGRVKTTGPSISILPRPKIIFVTILHTRRFTSLTMTSCGIEASPTAHAAKRSRLEPGARNLRQTTLPAAPFAFLRDANALEVAHSDLPEAEYVPAFGPGFEPKRNGPALLIRAGCGRGKSYAFREYMKRE